MATLMTTENIWTLRFPAHIHGSVDSWVTNILEEMSDSQPQTLIIELTFTKTIDSKGLSLLLTLQKVLAEQQVNITLKNPNQHLRDLFRIMQFDRLFKIDQDP